MRFFLVLCVLTAALATPATAQEAQSLVKSGQTVLNVSASERQTVPQDLLLASVRYESEGAEAKKVQDTINQNMSKALETAKKYPDVQASTDHYYVYPYDPNPPIIGPDGRPQPVSEKRPVVWKGSQGLQLKSKNSEALLKLLAELQEQGFQTSNLTYTLSPEKFESIRDAMMESALKKLSEKAERASKALGKKEAELVEVNVDTAYPNYPSPMMARAEMGMADSVAKFSAPVASPGETEINLTVSARAILK